ncbi:hypothetical protein ACE11G_15030 [Gordonia sp. PS3]|uniref:hypothetical protein n=1 Tax=Gordonia sp. PS3 TaxID=3248841 RepID=UPI0035C1CDAF
MRSAVCVCASSSGSVSGDSEVSASLTAAASINANNSAGWSGSAPMATTVATESVNGSVIAVTSPECFSWSHHIFLTYQNTTNRV